MLFVPDDDQDLVQSVETFFPEFFPIITWNLNAHALQSGNVSVGFLTLMRNFSWWQEPSLFTVLLFKVYS